MGLEDCSDLDWTLSSFVRALRLKLKGLVVENERHTGKMYGQTMFPFFKGVVMEYVEV